MRACREIGKAAFAFGRPPRRRLVEDGTYFVATRDERIVGCGGWSFRRRLFGGGDTAPGDAASEEPGVAPARMRGFFVHPAFARLGIARRILSHAEQAARSHGYRHALLQATVAGRPLYASQGYRVVAWEWIEVEGAPPLPSFRMEKRLAETRLRSGG